MDTRIGLASIKLLNLEEQLICTFNNSRLKTGNFLVHYNRWNTSKYLQDIFSRDKLDKG